MRWTRSKGVRSRKLLAAGAAILALVLGITAGSVTTALRMADASTLEPTNTTGAHPFVAAAGADILEPAGPPSTSGDTQGDAPWLFLDVGPLACAPTRIAEALRTESTRAELWANASDIDVAEISTYLARLTPLALGADTAVTQHDFRDGRTVSYDAVLQRGTAVLVTDRGLPVVKCINGNPLTPPEAGAPTEYLGSTWSGFSPGSTARISEADTSVGAFGVVNPDSGLRGTRRARGGDPLLGAPRPGVPWDLTAIEARDPYLNTPEDVLGYVAGCRAEPRNVCPADPVFEYWDPASSLWASTPATTDDDLADCRAANNDQDCQVYLHTIRYEPPPALVDDNGNPIIENGQRVPCDPARGQPNCRLDPNTKVFVQVSNPLTESERKAREDAILLENRKVGDLNPGRGDSVLFQSPPSSGSGTSTISTRIPSSTTPPPTPTTTTTTTAMTTPTTTTATSTAITTTTSNPPSSSSTTASEESGVGGDGDVPPNG